jgi:hypothetical protein
LSCLQIADGDLHAQNGTGGVVGFGRGAIRIQVGTRVCNTGSHGADQGSDDHIKAALRLTRKQKQYWPPVEAALRDMNRRGVHGVTMAAKPVVLDEPKLQQRVSAAMPLLMTLG